MDKLRGAIDELCAVIALSTDDRWMRPPAAGEWTAAEVCGHISELMPYWATAAAALSRAPGLSFGREVDDPDRVGAVRTGAGRTREQAAANLRSAAAQAEATIASIPVERWADTGMSANRESMSVRLIIERFIVGHVNAHVDQVTAALV